jgi:hypothetical protein
VSVEAKSKPLEKKNFFVALMMEAVSTFET